MFPLNGGVGDNATVYHGSGSIVTETGPSQPLDAVINCSGNGANAIIAAVAGRKIRVLAYLLVVTNGSQLPTWESSGGTVKSGPLPFAANGGASAPFCPVGHFDTVAGEGLTLFQAAGGQASGHVKYVLV